jgi:hypothetical protein
MPDSAPFSFNEFNHLIEGTEMLYALGKRLSIAVQKQRCEYLIQEALMAFVKMMMSLLGYLRFIPSSRYHAKAIDVVMDLSSASVMARQVMEDALSFFYLSEPNLTSEEKQFREDVWRLHGAAEKMGSARYANLSNREDTPVAAERERLSEIVAKHPLFKTLKDGGRIKKGQVGQILHDREILERRGIETDLYDLGKKVLSNFAHFSAFSHELMMETDADWEKSWRSFLSPALYAANFTAEAIAAFLETFPQSRQLLSEDERMLVTNWRVWLRTPFEPRIARKSGSPT